MKQIISFTLALLAFTGFPSPSAAAVPSLPDPFAAAPVPGTTSADLAEVAPSVLSEAAPETCIAAPVFDEVFLPVQREERKRQRFLPMRRRIDRKVDNIKFAYKGEVILGLTASYGTLTSEDTDYFLLLDNFNADGSITTVNPFIGYFYRDNRCVGVRFGYRHIGERWGTSISTWATRTTSTSRSTTWICRATTSRSGFSTAPTWGSTARDASGCSPSWSSR